MTPLYCTLQQSRRPWPKISLMISDNKAIGRPSFHYSKIALFVSTTEIYETAIEMLPVGSMPLSDSKGWGNNKIVITFDFHSSCLLITGNRFK